MTRMEIVMMKHCRHIANLRDVVGNFFKEKYLALNKLQCLSVQESYFPCVIVLVIWIRRRLLKKAEALAKFL